MNHTRLLLLILVCLLTLTPFSCKGEPDVWNIGVDPEEDWFDSTLGAEATPLVFTHLPVLIADLGQVFPLGMAGSHVFPADHIYLAQSARVTPQEMLTNATVYAPASGKIHYIETPEESSSTYDDYSIRIAVSKDVTYIFGHIMMDAEVLQRLHVGDMVEAGEILGTFGPVSKLDLYVLDRARGNSLDNDKYPMTMPYAQNPFSYFPDELREQLYDKLLPPKPAGSHDDAMAVLQRHDPTLDGGHSSSYLSLIDDSTQSTEEVFRTHYLDLRSTFPSIEGTFTYDIANCLQGNWFVPLSEGRWDEGISFHYDHWYPSQPRIRVSQPFPTVGEIRGFALLPSQDGFIPFADAAVGEEVVYVLYDTSFCNWHGVPYEDPLDVGNENPIGLLLVKIERSDMIKVEAFAYNSSLHADFTSHARYYYR
ncbi:MAG: M23 family metallopeptidase [Spirochaetales bacterium]|jgi:hypothetical protein|nr:M23 family metallopeptidase [Spirochaetales bacterium]